MRHLTRTSAIAAAGLMTLGLSTAAPAMAHDGPHEATDLSAQLTQLNDSGASGEAWVTVEGNEVTVKLMTEGLLKDAPHAQHIHIGGQNVCPTNDDTGNGFEGALQVSDAADQYGGIAVSLTKEPGKTGPEAGLDVPNYPVGSTTYERTIEVSDEVAHNLMKGDGQVVVHGVDHDGSGTYDGDVKSDLDPSLPSEATDPAACGELSVAQMDMPDGGAETGGGDTAGIENAGLLGGGAAALMAGAAGLFMSRRRAEDRA